MGIFDFLKKGKKPEQGNVAKKELPKEPIQPAQEGDINEKEKKPAQEKVAKEELPKELIQPAQEHDIKEAVKSLHDKIVESLEKQVSKKLKFGRLSRLNLAIPLASLLWQDAASCFPNKGFQWDSARFTLNLETGKIVAEVSTYPNQFGACRQDSFPLSAARFNEIAKKYHMSWELQLLATEEDWAKVFDDDLKAAVAENRAKLQKAEETRKNEEKQKNAVKIQTNTSPDMSISEVTLVLSQQYGKSTVKVTKENETYHIVYRASSKNESYSRVLEPAEGGWLEQMVQKAMNNPDDSTWQSLPGGDTMKIVIKRNNGENIELNGIKPLKKYYDLMGQLEKLVQYGSIKSFD